MEHKDYFTHVWTFSRSCEVAGEPPMSPPQELDRGAPGCLNILVEYITKMSRHPGAPFPSCLGAFGLIFGPLAPLQDHKEIQTYGKKSLDSKDTFISAILSNIVE